MRRYQHIYLWMIIPMVIMQAGIWYDYWGDFSENTWAVHVHYWNATAWYLFLITQPYLATHGRMELHRTMGIFGFFLAGGIGFLSFSMLHRDLVYVQMAAEMPERFGLFLPWFFYGIAAVEIVLLFSFVAAVTMAIIRRKSFEDHAWWLVATVFILMWPALGRGLQAVYISAFGFDNPVILMQPLHIAFGIIIAMTLGAAWRLGKLRHPATFLAVGANAWGFLMEPVGRSEIFQAALSAIIKA